MRKAFLLAKVMVPLFAVGLLAACYAPLANQNGHLTFDIQGGRALLNGDSQAIVLVVNADSQSTLKEILYFIGKSQHGGLTSGEADTLLNDAKEMATSGLVKIGGYPFFLTTLNGSSTSGSFDIPGVPAGRDYFVKLFVLNSTVTSFSASDLDENFYQLLQYENMDFDNEPYGSPGWSSYNTPGGWNPVAGMPVSVSSGSSTTVSVSLVTPP